MILGLAQDSLTVEFDERVIKLIILNGGYPITCVLGEDELMALFNSEFTLLYFTNQYSIEALDHMFFVLSFDLQLLLINLMCVYRFDNLKASFINSLDKKIKQFPDYKYEILEFF